MAECRAVELDLVTRWTLYFFGSLLAGGVLGFLVARLATFELGMGVGLLLPGLVSLSFALAFVQGYRSFAFDPVRVDGTALRVVRSPYANAVQCAERGHHDDRVALFQ